MYIYIYRQAFGTGPESMSEEVAFVYTYYKQTLLECHSLDFSALIGEAAKLLSTHEPAKGSNFRRNRRNS